MSEVSDISSILQNSLLANGVNAAKNERLQEIQNKLKNMPSVVDTEVLDKFKNGEYELSLKEYTDMSTYNTMMTALYGNRSANSFQNLLNLLTNSAEEEVANAKSFIDKMKEKGASNADALRMYSALKKYSLVSSYGNYNFVRARV